MTSNRFGAILAIAALATGFIFDRTSAAETDAAVTRATMREIFQSMRTLLPLSVSGEEFSAEDNRVAISEALRALADNAWSIAEHAREGEADVGFLGRALSREAEYAQHMYELGRFESAQFIVRQTTDNCVACHTKLPDTVDSSLAEQFVDETTLSELPLDERAKLQIATRRFDDALGAYETMLASTDTHPIELFESLTNYLILNIRVKQDFERPVPVLEKFAQRADVWTNLGLDLQAWISALRELGKRPALDSDLASIRQFIEDTNRSLRFPSDRQMLVHYIVVSSILHQYIASHSDRPVEAAEAYYLLGLTEYGLGQNEWLPQSELFLEAAIRLAPKSPFSKPAYALLEEAILAEYMDLEGTDMPVEITQALAELRALVDSE